MFRKFLKAKTLFAFSILFYFLCFFYDFIFGGNDGIIKDLYFHRFFIRILLLQSICLGLLYSSKSKTPIVKTISLNLIFAFFFLLFLEICSLVYFRIKNEYGKGASYILFYDNPKYKPVPTDKTRLYGDTNDFFGRWRQENNTQVVKRCSDQMPITYSSNSVGARDEERDSLGKNRIVFLGDSFTEGVLLNVEERLSNILEEKSGIAHLNFAIMGANPMAYFQIYNNLVKPKFEHEAVIVGIFAGNDFDSFENSLNGGFLNVPNFRAYWGENGTTKYTISSYQNSIESFYAIEHPEVLRTTRDSLYSSASFFKKIKLELETSSNLISLIYDLSRKLAIKNQSSIFGSMYVEPLFGTPLANDFLKSMDSIVETSKGKEIVFVLMPDLRDIKKFNVTKTNKFTPFIEQRYGVQGVNVIDLLPSFVNYKGRVEDLFISCDGHWNEKGNKLAAEAIFSNPKYQKVLLKLKNNQF
ncbi:hypothetical protein EGI22_09410 [Lacihabitans sp. LS3-19]|uniref:hypothetical protein n=1 Tax=Lacihabitans sp. LS3-19 TaxID=2487335 RepID=UPI0020CC1D20|nr:hypothetical protein [Lacihabitans sp. LS3-19]MCP9768129.1 hypothetical protein [Lacihabitans sp. LS3-19]